jgi:hypothetical protein
MSAFGWLYDQDCACTALSYIETRIFIYKSYRAHQLVISDQGLKTRSSLQTEIDGTAASRCSGVSRPSRAPGGRHP